MHGFKDREGKGTNDGGQRTGHGFRDRQRTEDNNGGQRTGHGLGTGNERGLTTGANDGGQRRGPTTEANDGGQRTGHGFRIRFGTHRP